MNPLIDMARLGQRLTWDEETYRYPDAVVTPKILRILNPLFRRDKRRARLEEGH